MPAVLLEKHDQELPDEELPVSPADLDRPTHVSAFMLLVDHDGNYVFEPDINKPITTVRPPTSSEVKGALATVLSDIQVQETAVLASQFVMGNLQMQARAAFDAQQNSQVLQKIGMKR